MPADRGFTPLNAAAGTTAAAADTAGTEQQPAAAEDQQRIAAIWEEFKGILTQIAPFLIDKFRDPDETGFDFRDWFIRKYGMNNWTTLRQKVSIQDFVTLSQQHPQLREALSPPEEFAEFLTEVFTFPDEEPEGAVRTGAAN